LKVTQILVIVKVILFADEKQKNGDCANISN